MKCQKIECFSEETTAKWINERLVPCWKLESLQNDKNKLYLFKPSLEKHKMVVLLKKYVTPFGMVKTLPLQYI